MSRKYQVGDITIYTFSFMKDFLDARMYILLCHGEAIVIDPCESSEAEELLEENGITDVQILLTHEHYDHISGVNAFCTQFRCTVTCSKMCARAIGNPGKNLSRYLNIFLQDLPVLPQRWNPDYRCRADIWFEGEMQILFADHRLRLLEAPGHSLGSILIFVDTRCLFSGDSLIPGKSVVTKLPGGDRNLYRERVLPLINSLDGAMMVFPGHYGADRLDQILGG